MPDIDIDFGNREDILKLIKHIPASISRDGAVVKHNTGVYVNPIPQNPLTGLSNIDYESAEELGYMKLDLLNVHVYNSVRSNEHLDELVAKEPDWNLLKDKEFVDKLMHLNNHYDIVQQHFPDTMDKLAMVLAIIRPSKRYLIGKRWKEIANEIWLKPTEGYYFKRAHAVSYAQLVMVHMNLLTESFH
jgi:hypothetical protein